MKNLKFKYAKAVNFLCFGPEGVEINFEQLGNIVLIQAQNLDVSTTKHASSNGAGKSSLPEIPVYALYGKTIKKPKKLHQENVVNFSTGDKLMVEFRWDDYRVVRTVSGKKTKTTKVRLWKSADGIWNKDTEITRGGQGATQKYIEEELIGLNYETFINLYVINADDPTSCFLECDTPTKREIVEDLLSLEKYRDYHENAKALVKTAKEKVQLLARDYSYLMESLQNRQNQLDEIEQQEKKWQKDRDNEIGHIGKDIELLVDKLESSDTGAALLAYKEAQEQIVQIKQSIPTFEQNRDSCQQAINLSESKCKEFNAFLEQTTESYKLAFADLKTCREIIAANQKILDDYENKIAGGSCPYCERPIDASVFEIASKKAKKVIQQETENLPKLTESHDVLKKQRDEKQISLDKAQNIALAARKKLEKLNHDITIAFAQIAELSKIKEPQAGVDERLLQERLDELNNKLKQKQTERNGPSPYVAIKTTAVNELTNKRKEVDDKKAEVEKAEKELPYYNFWVKAFSDTGIRKYIINGIIPTLNNQIAYWLQFLIDNKIKLTFDDQLKETIDRWPFQKHPYVYHGMSGGQRRRLNLSIAPSFGHIMSLNTGCSLSVVFLDEVSMNMDEVGVNGIYRFICELAKDRQVFVIDHHQMLLQLLDGCDLIQLEMKNLVTTRTK